MHTDDDYGFFDDWDGPPTAVTPPDPPEVPAVIPPSPPGTVIPELSARSKSVRRVAQRKRQAMIAGAEPITFHTPNHDPITVSAKVNADGHPDGYPTITYPAPAVPPKAYTAGHIDHYRAMRKLDGDGITPPPGSFPSKLTPGYGGTRDTHRLDRLLSAKKRGTLLSGTDQLTSNTQTERMLDDWELVLHFLGQFRWASVSIIATLLGSTETAAKGLLVQMRAAKLVADAEIIDGLFLWRLTKRGADQTILKLPIPNQQPALSMMAHWMAGVYIGANLMGGQHNVLNLPGFPAGTTIPGVGYSLPGEFVLSEPQIKRSHRQQHDMTEAALSYRSRLMTRRAGVFAQWRQHVTTSGQDRAQIIEPEFLPGNEWLYVGWPPNYVQRKAYHVPDLVVARRRGLDMAGQSLAVEIELKDADVEDYTQTMRGYDQEPYAGVVWLVSKPRVERKLAEAAEAAGMAERTRIMPLEKVVGVNKNQDWWRLISSNT